MELSERQKKVLRAIVEDYIMTAEPVGSRTISKKYALGVSSATIRNEMADLEDMGYLIQPHTSAGRTPSDDGYRYYTRRLVDDGEIADEDNPYLTWLSEGHTNDEATRQALLRRLSEDSGYVSMLYLPPAAGDDVEVLALLHLLYLAPGRILLVVVTDEERVAHALLEVPLGISPQDLSAVEGLLNHYLRGLPSRYWAQPIAESMKARDTHLAELITLLVRRLGRILSEEEGERVQSDGFLKLLETPEFQDLEKIRDLYACLEKKDRLEALLAPAMPASFDVTIGEALAVPALVDCALLRVRYQVGKQSGHLALLGPKRMQYDRALRLLHAAAEAMEKAFGPQYMLIPERQSELAPLLHSFAWQFRKL